MSLGLLLFGLAAQAAAGEPHDDIKIPRIVPERRCGGNPADAEIVVCGRRDETEKYRLRGTGRSRASHRGWSSWGARVAEQGERDRYGSQAVGPSGYLQGSRQLVREWRVEREEQERAKREEARMIDEAASAGPPE